MTEANEEHDGYSERLANIVARIVTKVRTESLPDEQRAKYAALTDFLEGIEQEGAPLAGRMFQRHAESEHMPDGLRELFGLIGQPEHQSDAILQIFAMVGAAISSLFVLGPIELQKEINELRSDYSFVPVSTADAADAVVRNIWTQDIGAAEAKMSGVNGDNFDVLVKLTGEPPGPMDMLSLWRRGIITEDFLDTAIRYSRIKDVYIDSIKALAHSYMSPADVIELAIKGLKTPDEAQTMYGIAGGLEDQFQILYEGAGDAIGNQAALTLMNHGYINEAQVKEVFGRSRMNPLFYDMAMNLKHHFLSVIQVELALKAGSVAPEVATKWLTADGYPADQIAAFVSGAAAAKSGGSKAETETMVVAMYTDHLYDSAEATVALANLGYTASEADMILQLADAKRALSQTTTAISAIRGAYLARRITKAQAGTDLDTLAVPAKARDAWLDAWEVELTTKVKELTVAEIGGLAKKSFLSYPNAMERWVAMGYSEADAFLLALNYGYTPPATTTTAPAK